MYACLLGQATYYKFPMDAFKRVLNGKVVRCLLMLENLGAF